MKPTIRLGKIGGVPIGVHYSWFAVVALVWWGLAVGFLPGTFPGWGAGAYWAAGVVAALMLFASVLLHELAHSLVAKSRGFPVEGITLFFLGGVSNLKSESKRPWDELIISAVGPLASLALAAVFGVAVLALQDDGPGSARVWFLVSVELRNAPLVAVVWYVALANLLLAVFNLLPAFPLDGGRVLRSSVWAVTGSFSRATMVAGLGGQVVGMLLVVLGGLGILNGFLVGGLWFALLGWYLHGAATTSRREITLRTNVGGVVVKDVMDSRPLTIGPDVPLSDAVFRHFLSHGSHSLPVCEDEGGKLVGILTLTDIRGVPRAEWEVRKVRDAMTPMPLWQVSPDEDLLSAMGVLGEHGIHQAPVIDGDRLVGVLSRAHIIRSFRSRDGEGRR